VVIPEDIAVEEKKVVCYAQHWVENDSQPDEEYENQIRESYGEEGFDSIQMILRMIQMGNFLGIPGIIFFTGYPLTVGGPEPCLSWISSERSGTENRL